MDSGKNLSPQDSIMLIQSMINKVQNRFVESGFLYLLWGWVVFLCSLIQFVILKLHLPVNGYGGAIWLSLIVVVVYQVFYLIKVEKKKRATTYFDEMIKYVWMTFGICMGVVSFLFFKFNLLQVIYPFILMMYGIPTFLSGFALNFNPLKIGGISCWLLAIIAAFFDPVYSLLFISIAMMTAWIIPGYLMKAKFKKANTYSK